MAGMGTKDVQLIYRLIRTYWNPQRMAAVKDAYKRRFRETPRESCQGGDKRNIQGIADRNCKE